MWILNGFLPVLVLNLVLTIRGFATYIGFVKGSAAF